MAVHKFFILQIFNINNRPDLIIRRYLHQVLNGSSLAGFITFGNFIHIQPVAPSFFGKEQHGMVRRGNKQMFNIIFLPGFAAHRLHGHRALRTVFGSRSSFDITEMRNGDHHIFFLDQVFDAALHHRGK